MRAIICAVGIGDGGAIENVKHLDPELGTVAFLEREGLEQREVPVPEAVVAEDVSAHVAKFPRGGRSHDRVAVYEAAAGAERTCVGSHSLTLPKQDSGCSCVTCAA